jgi:hypothetical protein
MKAMVTLFGKLARLAGGELGYPYLGDQERDILAFMDRIGHTPL